MRKQRFPNPEVTVRFILCSTAAGLAKELSGEEPFVTIEAYYAEGDVMVFGTALTMSHHGPFATPDALAPCLYPNTVSHNLPMFEKVGLNSFTLNVLGGCMALRGEKPDHPDFWKLVAHVDAHGRHRLMESEYATAINLRHLYTYWEWESYYRFHGLAEVGENFLDVTDQVAKATRAIWKILEDHKDFEGMGDKYRKQEAELMVNTLLEARDGVVVRASEKYVGHLCMNTFLEPQQAVVYYFTTAGSITIAFGDPRTDKNALMIAKELWGPLSRGGRKEAVSPPGKRMTLADLTAAVDATIKALSEPPSDS